MDKSGTWRQTDLNMLPEERLEDGQILLLRQIHPSWIQEDEVSTAAFTPESVTTLAFKATKEHNFKLSTAHQEMIGAEEAWERHTQQLGRTSVGVMAVSVDECHAQELPAIHDRYEFEDHVSIDFNGLSNGKRDRKASALRTAAQQRGWQFLAASQ